MNNLKYILYARKSTDVEDKQVLSIDAQLAELRAYAKQNRLEIVDELIEKQSAKIPGRPIFNDMIRRIENGEINAILSWHPDRLARNSVDGGKLIYLVDTGRLAALKFNTFWFEPTPQGKFMLNIAFGQSKYYIDSLSENTKRGLRQKVRRGEYPSCAPIGYINDSRVKKIFVDKKRSTIIREAFELYAQNQSRLDDVSHFLAQSGISSKTGKRIHISRATFILSNPFYTGLFRYAGEVYEGKHDPIITKQLFDRVQEIMKQRGRVRTHVKNQPQAFCGLLRCGTCGMGITAEIKVKRQKNGNVHEYTYYRCTRKSKTTKCAAPFVRQENLDQQLSSLLQTVSLRSDWAEKMTNRLNTEEAETAQSVTACVGETKQQITVISDKLQRLLDGYLEQDIDRNAYVENKVKLMSTKKTLEQNISSLTQQQSTRLVSSPRYLW